MRRRFLAKSDNSSYWAKRAQHRKKVESQMVSERRRKRFETVSVLREYRSGEVSDRTTRVECRMDRPIVTTLMVPVCLFFSFFFSSSFNTF